LNVEAPEPTAHTAGAGLGRTVARTTLTLVLGRVLALVAGIATVSLASRYLGLDDFGALNAGMAYATLFAILADLGLSTVATRELSRHPENERHILGSVLGIGVVLALMAAGLGLVLMRLAYGGAHAGATREAILILLSQVLVAPVTGVTRAFFIARQRGYLVACGDITLAVGMAVFTTIAVVADLGYRAVVIAIAAGYIAQAIVMAVVATSAGARMRPQLRGGKRLVLIALPLGGTLAINYLYFRLDVLLLSWLKTDADVARYSLAYRVLEGLMVLPSYVMLALFPVIARHEHDRLRLSATIGVALGGLEAAALPLAALMAIFSPEIVVALGGHKYASAAPVVAILALALAISCVSGVFGNALMALGRQRTLFWLTLGPLGVNLVANLALIPPLGVNGAAIAVVLSELAGVGLVRAYYLRVAGPPQSPSHWRILAAGVVLLVLGALKFALGLHSKPLLVTVVGGLLGCVMYAAALLGLGALPSAIVDQIPLPNRLLKILPRR
jgi:O-antigen/teichoic acid export membrane protein